LADAYASAQASLPAQTPVAWASGGAVAGARDLDAALARASSTRPDRSARATVRTGDNLFFIYTSGTTGNPKAAYFSHARFLQVAGVYAVFVEIVPEDRVYCVLPLYHTAGGVVATSLALLEGASLVLREKFSVSRFWEDCSRYRVTVFQYIGELCRYLLAGAPSEHERSHRVRCAVGNGLRPDIWERFQQRFGIPRILEFYGATEGNVAMINLDGKVGAVGRIPPYARPFLPVRLVRYDVASDTHVRGPDGFCVEAGVGEVGEAIGPLPKSERDPAPRFEGYRDEAASEKKILRNVFAAGDAWYRSGDLLRCDRAGYYYFVDRIGDTFRWKGENVSTSEVAEVLSRAPGVEEVNVYGVQVPGHDGRAGMAAVIVRGRIDLEAVYRHATVHLPVYARPLFLRLTSQLDTTATFKHRKVDFAEQGFDPARVGDPLYFRDDSARTYVPMDRALYDRLCAGAIKL
jgi:fatty-acyl-CoA synthase